MIKLNQLKKTAKNSKRVGRGISSGKGKTCGRGTKGQKSRSGRTIPRGFEGGQTPLKQRLPKYKGFFRRNNIAAKIISLADIAACFKAGESLTLSSLQKKGLIDRRKQKIKIVSSNKFNKKIKFKFVPISQKALALIKKAGGTVSQKK